MNALRPRRRVHALIRSASIAVSAPALMPSPVSSIIDRLVVEMGQAKLVASLARVYEISLADGERKALLQPWFDWQRRILSAEILLEFPTWTSDTLLRLGRSRAVRRLTRGLGEAAAEHFQDLADGGSGLGAWKLGARALERLRKESIPHDLATWTWPRVSEEDLSEGVRWFEVGGTSVGASTP